VLHNAWIAAAGLDAVYAPFGLTPGGFGPFVEGLRGGASVAGVNVTLPFKAEALDKADEASPRARLAQAANVLVFRPDGTIFADNTDGLGLLGALAAQAPGFDPTAGPVAILGAGGGAQGAAAAFVEAGCPQVRIANRTLAKAQRLAVMLGDRARAYALTDDAAYDGVCAVINATSAGLASETPLDVPWRRTPGGAVAMDMVYKPLRTPFLIAAEAAGRQTVDGLEMLVRQAVPSFEHFFGRTPPAEVDVRSLALQHLDASA
jgi:shikimate dehydrogenase